jgi:phosphotransferase system enzyme I (PtsI)
LAQVVKAGREGDREVSICGEMAGDPVMVPMLIGLGIESLSIAPGLLPNVKFVVQSMTLKEAKDLAEMALSESDSTTIYGNLLVFYKERMASLY